MSFTEASTLEGCEQTEPKTAARHEGSVTKMHVGLDHERNESREEARRRRDLSRGTIEV